MYWGQLKEEQSDEESGSDELDEMSEGEVDVQSLGQYEDSDDELEPGMRSGIASIVNNVQVGGVDIRKQELQKKTDKLLESRGTEFEQPTEDEGIKPLYQILKQVDTNDDEGKIMGVKHTYEYPDSQNHPEEPEKVEEVPQEAMEPPKKPKKEKKEKIKYKF